MNTKAADRLLQKHGFDVEGNRARNTTTRPSHKKKKAISKHRIQRLRVRERMKKSKWLVRQRQEADRSAGEKRIEVFLMENNIRFVAEHSTTYCYSRKTNHLLFFDFWLPDHNMVIEFDGIHHFKPIYGDEKLAEQKYKDKTKNQYCRKRGIRMLRIPCFVKDVEKAICIFFDRYGL